MSLTSDSLAFGKLQLFETIPHAWLDWDDQQLKVQSSRGLGDFLRKGDSHKLEYLLHPDDVPAAEEYLQAIDTEITIMNFNTRQELGMGSRITSSAMKVDGRKICLWTSLEVSDQSMMVLHHAAHDFRSPINLIIGVVNMMQFILQEGAPDKVEFGKMLDMIKANCKQAIDLTTDVLELAELESRKFTLTTKVVRIVDFLTQYVDTHRLLTMRKRIRVDLRCETSACVEINEMKLTRVMDNLINNSVKFSHPDSTLHITAEESGQQVRVHIRDEGVGMSEKLLSDLFVRYGRSQRRGLEGEVSHGLGMSIVKQIMDLHSGEVQVESKEGVGTKVTLVFRKTE